MRMFLGALFHETNDFSPVPTGRASFKELSWRPAELPEPPPTVNLLGYGGALARARQLGLDVAAGPYSVATPSTRAGTATWASLRDELFAELRTAQPVDAVFLFLHGAMAVEGVDDCEGELLAGVRALVGPGVPIGTVLDLHGNVTRQMLENADLLVACKEFPHIDFAEESAHVVNLLVAQVEGRVRPVSAAVSLPMLAIAPTTFGCVKAFVGRMREREAAPGVLAASAFHGFFGADHPHTGASIVVTTDGDRGLARQCALDLARDFAGAVREQGNVGLGLDAALAAARHHSGTVVMADRADNTGGGAAGDSTLLLAELLRRGFENTVLGMVWDPVAADFCHLAGEGSRLKLRLGGKIGPMSGDPLDLDAEVLVVRDDVRQAFFGVGPPDLPIGRSALIRVGGIDVVIASVRQQVFSRHVFEGHGVDLGSKKLIVVKSTQHFYEAFASLGKVLYCDLPGTCAMNFTTLPYRRLRRPMWPIDEIAPEPSPLFPVHGD